MLVEDLELIFCCIRRALWATNADHVFISIRSDADSKESDPAKSLFAYFENVAYNVYPFSEAKIIYPNGVSHHTDLRKMGLWVSVGPFEEEEDGTATVGVQVYVNHLVNFQRRYQWRNTPRGWEQVGKITARVR